MRSRTFYIAKINIHGNIFSQNLDEIINIHIPRVILNPQTLKLNTWNWSFTDIGEYQHDNKIYIIGNVTKSKYKKEKFKMGTKTFEEKLQNEVAQTAFFVYDPSSELLVHESNSSISAMDFRNLFTLLLSRDPLVGDVIINPIPVPYVIKNELLAMDKVTRITFNLIHPNPGAEEFNLYNKIIDENNLRALNIDMENESGIKLRGEENNGDTTTFNSTIENGIELVESGYGEIDLNGFDEIEIEGKRKKRVKKYKKSFSSKNSIRHIKIKETEGFMERIVSFIRSTITKS